MSKLVAQLANQIKETGRHSTSELQPLLEQAERLADDETQDVLTRALACRAAGNALRLLNRYQASLDRYDRAVGLLDTDQQPVELGRTLHAKLVPLFFLGRFPELFTSAERAQALFQAAGDFRGIARLKVNLAHAYHRLDRHAEALECSEAAVDILKELGDIEGYVAAAINSATTLANMHEFSRAEERYREALKMAESGDLWTSVLLCRQNIAYLRYFSGNAEEALRSYAELLVEYAKIKDDWQICRCRLDESEILLEIGDLEEAMHAAHEAYALAHQLNLNLEIGRALLFEAAALIRLDRTDQAAPLLEEATRRFQKEGNNVWTAVCSLQAAIVRPAPADPSTISAALAARSLLRGSGLPHRVAMANVVVGRMQRSANDAPSAIESFRTALDAARGSHSKWMQFHACYELALSLSALEPQESSKLFHEAEQLLDSIWGHLGSDDLKLAFLADRENVYTYLVPSSLEQSATAAFELSEKARSRVLREQLNLGKPSAIPAEIPSRLVSDEVVIEYFIAGNDLYIFTVSTEGVYCVLRKNTVEDLRMEYEGLERHFSSCSIKWERLQAVQHHLRETANRHLGKLFDGLVRPVMERLARKVIFVPHGFLHHVPFHALFDGQRFLADERRISYSPSASLFCTAPPDIEPQGPLFIAFGSGRLSSEEEVREAAKHFPNPTTLINPTLADLQAALASPRSLVHIAGHAGIDAIGGRLSWIQTPEGRLTSRDLVSMQIRTRTLVVTGCQTARRIIRPGDEWLGLMRSFYESGASAIVSALWEIRDESAQRFSSSFYDFFDGHNAAEAVQHASSVLQAWRAHPYFWAGFGAFVRRTA